MREAFTLDTLKGTVKSIIYRNAENGYSVIEVTDDNGDERTVVGPAAAYNHWRTGRVYG